MRVKITIETEATEEDLDCLDSVIGILRRISSEQGCLCNEESIHVDVLPPRSEK